jgi:hypothetical protein
MPPDSSSRGHKNKCWFENWISKNFFLKSNRLYKIYLKGSTCWESGFQALSHSCLYCCCLFCTRKALLGPCLNNTEVYITPLLVRKIWLLQSKKEIIEFKEIYLLSYSGWPCSLQLPVILRIFEENQNPVDMHTSILCINILHNIKAVAPKL